VKSNGWRRRIDDWSRSVRPITHRAAETEPGEDLADILGDVAKKTPPCPRADEMARSAGPGATPTVQRLRWQTRSSLQPA